MAASHRAASAALIQVKAPMPLGGKRNKEMAKPRRKIVQR